MSVDVEFTGHPTPDGPPSARFADADLAAAGVGTYCFHVGGGGELIILIDERGESRVDQVYGPTAWRRVRGDVWRKGMLLQH